MQTTPVMLTQKQDNALQTFVRNVYGTVRAMPDVTVFYEVGGELLKPASQVLDDDIDLLFS